MSRQANLWMDFLRAFFRLKSHKEIREFSLDLLQAKKK